MMASGTAGADDQRKDPVASIAGQVAHLSTGDRAALRRLYLTKRHEADGVVIGLLHRAGVALPAREETFAPWRLLAHVAALLSGTAGTQPHAQGRRVGSALHAAGYSENRLLRLTAARGTALADQLIRAARVLARDGRAAVDLWSVRHLVSGKADRAEAARIRLAQDFYAAAARAEKGSPQ